MAEIAICVVSSLLISYSIQVYRDIQFNNQQLKIDESVMHIATKVNENTSNLHKIHKTEMNTNDMISYNTLTQ